MTWCSKGLQLAPSGQARVHSSLKKAYAKSLQIYANPRKLNNGNGWSNPTIRSEINPPGSAIGFAHMQAGSGGIGACPLLSVAAGGRAAGGEWRCYCWRAGGCQLRPRTAGESGGVISDRRVLPRYAS